MRRFVFALALLAAAGCDRPAQPAVEYRPGQAGTVDHALCLLGYTGIVLSETATGHHLVEASLNGRPATFIVDTGANLSVLHQSHAAAFGLDESGPVRGAAVGIGGAMQARLAPIDSLTLGDVEIRQERIAVADLSRIADVLGRMTGGTVHGIIGQDVLAEHRAVIDVANSLLHLIPADQGPAPVPAEQCQAPPDDAQAGNSEAAE